MPDSLFFCQFNFNPILPYREFHFIIFLKMLFVIFNINFKYKFNYKFLNPIKILLTYCFLL